VIRVFLAEDHELFASGVRTELGRDFRARRTCRDRGGRGQGRARDRTGRGAPGRAPARRQRGERGRALPGRAVPRAQRL
jgi:hypothetical protein